MLMVGHQVNTFERWQFLQLPVVAQAEARGAVSLVLFHRCLGTWLLPLQQLSGGGGTVARLPAGVLQKQEKTNKGHGGNGKQVTLELRL